jgi:quercetin dioxygenase-like cupin family protein
MRILAVLVVLVLVQSACAHEGPQVVPQAERDRAQAEAMQGPTANQGIESVTPVGTVPLKGEIKGADDRMLRARELVIAPGGVVAVHRHEQRPGLAYILEGEIVEHRNDAPQPIVRRAGDAAFEWTGVVHWWENRSKKNVRALVVDIVPVE